MRKLDRFFNALDKKIDRKFSWFYVLFRKYFVVFSSTFLSLLLILSFFKVYYNKPYFKASLISTDLKNIHEALYRIDKKCNILQVHGNRIALDFLTVKQFQGSVVGGMNLAFPDKWLGPYLRQNPVMQQKYYEIVKVEDGYFIIPGDGVFLPNGKTIGKEVKINRRSNMDLMLQPGGDLFFKGIRLAKKIEFKVGDWDPAFQVTPAAIEDINSILKEFNEAMPFTHNGNRTGLYNESEVVKV